MQLHSIELAARILVLLEGENFRESINALKIANILLPSPSDGQSREAPEAHEECHVIG